MSLLLEHFLAFHRDATKQIGQKFCIPASLCNALRLCGVEGCTQRRIRNEWYAERGIETESNLDDQMEGADFSILETLERRTTFIQGIDNSISLDRVTTIFSICGKPTLLFPLSKGTSSKTIPLSFLLGTGFTSRIESKSTDSTCGLCWSLTSLRTMPSSTIPFPMNSVEPQSQTTFRSVYREERFNWTWAFGGASHSDYSCLALWKDPVK